MLSRLVILAVAREIAEGMERAGVIRWEIQDWTQSMTEIVLRPASTIQETRVLEDAVCRHVRLAFDMLGECSDE